jgi:hypothetical protein
MAKQISLPNIFLSSLTQFFTCERKNTKDRIIFKELIYSCRIMERSLIRHLVSLFSSQGGNEHPRIATGSCRSLEPRTRNDLALNPGARNPFQGGTNLLVRGHESNEQPDPSNSGTFVWILTIFFIFVAQL